MSKREIDVLAVSIDDSKVLWTYRTVGEKNAEAVIKMAVIRQGVEGRFYTTAPAGAYETGDIYRSGGQ